MSSSERIPLMKRSIFWLVILIMIAGATYIYEKDLFSNGLEAITVSTNSKKLPIYRVNTDKPMVALSIDAACGNEDTQKIHDILKKCSAFNVPMAGVYIDGELKAFTVGSLNERENMAVIHIEKADPEINGLYQFINQQFLVHEFPDVALVNREDDVGMPGLRKAKMSYYPVDFARKYSVKKKY